MSTMYFKIYPLDSLFVPSKEQVEAALEQFREIGGSEFEAIHYPEVEFIDPGAYLDVAICPICGIQNILTPDDNQGHEWICALDNVLHSGKFESIKTTLPTCGHSVNLSSLKFDSPAGFAKFELCVRDPELNIRIPKLLNRITKIFGTPVNGIMARY